MNDLISVVVTCYNHGQYIKDCLESIFNQTYQRIELFVINDGSTDNSLQIIEDSLEKSPFSKTTFLTRENRGVVTTRNQGLDIINGSYLLFVDSDNYLQEDYIEKLYETSKKTSADIVYSSLIDAETREIFVKGEDFDLERLIQGNYIDMCSLIRVEVIGQTQFDDFFNHQGLEDYDFFLNLILVNGAKAVYCPKTFLNYRVLVHSRSNRGNLKKYYALYAYILNKHIDNYSLAVSKALAFHFDKLTDLDIEHSIKQEKLSIYLSESGNFGEESDFQFPILFEDHIEIPVTSKIKKIRIKPSNIPSFYESFSITVNKYNTQLLPLLTNGIINGDALVFEDFYPFIDYKINLQEDEILHIDYKRYNISDIVSEDYIGKVLARQQREQSVKILELEQELQSLQGQLTEIEDDAVELLQQYSRVINSRRWSIPTKILNFFRRRR